MTPMTLTFWGTRGSIPTPGRRTEKYGGNTTCFELRHAQTRVIVDAGSGIRELGESWLAEGDAPVEAHLLFTHLHWDHIQGFPFFATAYAPGNRLEIHGAAGVGIETLLSGQMQGAYFPIPLQAMQAELTFQSTRPEFALGSLTVRTQRLPHPGGCLGYRFEAGDHVLVLATDCELDQVARNREQLASQPHAAREFAPELLAFFAGADVLVIDCQYTDQLYATRAGWGHNPVATVVELAAQAQPKVLTLTHHDPSSSDADVSQMVADVGWRLQQRGVDLLVMAARERLSMTVEPPKRPAALAAAP